MDGRRPEGLGCAAAGRHTPTPHFAVIAIGSASARDAVDARRRRRARIARAHTSRVFFIVHSRRRAREIAVASNASPCGHSFIRAWDSSRRRWDHRVVVRRRPSSVVVVASAFASDRGVI